MGISTALLSALLLVASAHMVAAAGVVGTGAAASCTDAAFNVALAGGGLVAFNCGPAPVTIDISTGTGTKTIATDTTIDGGSGSLITISGGDSVGVFSVNQSVNFTVQNLTIANGNGFYGGGIYNYNGTLTVTNSTFLHNMADQGGAIANGGPMTVTNSTFSNNSASAYGGAISNGDIAYGSTQTVTNSTFSGNSTYYGGGGIASYNATLTVTNSTFSGNSTNSEGSGIDNGGTLTVINSTFSGNSASSNGGGGIANNISYGGTITVTNSILANRTLGGNCAGTVTDGGHNVADDGSCGFSGTATNPLLDPIGLADHGGPTQTIALCGGAGVPSVGCTAASPAINAGDETVCSATTGTAPVDNLDQRAYVRPGAGATSCSIGAYEYNAIPASPTPTPPPSPTPTVTATFSLGVVGRGTAASCTEAELSGALASGRPITFDCGASPVTITVTSTKTINADTVINGGGLITISGGNSVGVFSVNTGVTFTVQNLTIADGQNSASKGDGGGGGIYNNGGTLTVTNSTFCGNAADGFGGAIYNTGTLTVTNSTFASNYASTGGAINNGESHGGILVGGTLAVTNSTFSGNSADVGGAIENDGPLTVTNSTFSGNSADADGGGGIGNYYNMLTVTNCTFSGNSANSLASGYGFGGAILNYGPLTVTNSTFSGNGASVGGGIYQGGTLTVINTILANSTSGGNCSGSVTDGGHNIDSDGTCGVGPATDPLLDPTGLASNGGPTQTIALQAGSPAINAGDETVCSTTTGTAPVDNLDQRGYVRPGAGATNCSIGAYEYSQCVVGIGTAASCNETAFNACLPANGRSFDIVTFRCGGPATITVSSTKTISANTTIDGGGPTTISGGKSVGVFSVNAGVEFTVQNLTIANGYSAGSGAGLFNGGVNEEGSIIAGGTVRVTNSIFSGNIAADNSGGGGGGISNTGTLTVTNGTFASNSCNSNNAGRSGYGGAILNDYQGTLAVTSSTFSSNTASYAGGGIANLGALTTVTSSIFSDNSSPNVSGPGGGGIYNAGTLTVTSDTFSGNSSGYSGGAISSWGTLMVSNSTFSANTVSAYIYGGGAISNIGIQGTVSALTVTNSTFFDNSAGGLDGDGGGGGIYNNGNTETVITNSTFFGNGAPAGGGGAIANGGIDQDGGVVAAGPITVINTVVANSTQGNNCDTFGRSFLGGHNIDDDGSCGFLGASLSNTNAGLDPAGLANNGGPTQTIALCGGIGIPNASCTSSAASPAINAGDESICTAPPVNKLDQRGYVRPGVGATSCSIGAYEYNSPGPPPLCVGDCNSDGQVTVDEILTMVNIALGDTPVTTCEAGDANHDGEITIDEILTAVSNALNGCGG